MESRPPPSGAEEKREDFFLLLEILVLNLRAQPDLIHEPELALLKEYMLSLGAKLPSPSSSHSSSSSSSQRVDPSALLSSAASAALFSLLFHNDSQQQQQQQQQQPQQSQQPLNPHLPPQLQQQLQQQPPQQQPQSHRQPAPQTQPSLSSLALAALSSASASVPQPPLPSAPAQQHTSLTQPDVPVLSPLPALTGDAAEASSSALPGDTASADAKKKKKKRKGKKPDSLSGTPGGADGSPPDSPTPMGGDDPVPLSPPALDTHKSLSSYAQVQAEVAHHRSVREAFGRLLDMAANGTTSNVGSGVSGIATSVTGGDASGPIANGSFGMRFLPRIPTETEENMEDDHSAAVMSELWDDIQTMDFSEAPGVFLAINEIAQSDLEAAKRHLKDPHMGPLLEQMLVRARILLPK